MDDSIAFSFLSGCKKDKNAYYEQMKKDIAEETIRYLNIASPSGCSGPMTMDEKILIVQAGIDEEKLLDIDKKSYCKVTVVADCDESLNWKLDIDLHCKNYEG